VQVQVRPHEFFERDGDDLYCTVPVSFITAALGGELDVPTLAGKATLKIPESTQSGKNFRLRGLGVKPVRGGPPGDLLCRVVLETPVNLTRKQKDILREFQETMAPGKSGNSPEASSWVEKAKKFFESHIRG
jgi:molecular chaperone DnaJ